MKSIYHHCVHRATSYYHSMSMVDRVATSYSQWLLDQGAMLKLRDNDNTWWVDFKNEAEYLMFVLRWM